MNNSRFYQIKNYYSHLKNPRKYVGSTRVITCRSSWEIKFIKYYLDVNDNILEWTSEDFVVPYICGTDGREHRYFVDFWFKAKTTDGSIKEFACEIKPFAETMEPKVPKRKTKSYIDRIKTYIKNQSKWKSATAICESMTNSGRTINFIIITEKDCPFFLK